MVTDNGTSLLQTMTPDNWINLIAAILVGGGTLALAFMTWKSIRQTRSIHERERRERLLNEIIEWATEIKTVFFEADLPKIDPSFELYIEEKAEGNQQIIEGFKRNIVNKEHQRIEFETLRKYAIPVSRAVYIEALASEKFKGHGIVEILGDIFDNVVALEFLIGTGIGVENPKKGFGESATLIMNRVEEELKSPGSTIDKLLIKYHQELSRSIDTLYTNAAKIISDL